LEKELWKKVKDVPEWSYIEQEHFAEVGK
jgi:histone acetyltransferase